MRVEAVLLALALTVTAAAAAQDVRTAGVIATRTPTDCTRPDCHTRWHDALGGGFEAAIRERDEDGGRERILELVVTHAGTEWARTIETSGLRCGGTSEFSHSASFRRATLRDFAAGPRPEIFVDYGVSVIGGEGPAVHQEQTIVCSVDGAQPSCLGAYVAGGTRSFPARGRIAFGELGFDVVFP